MRFAKVAKGVLDLDVVEVPNLPGLDAPLKIGFRVPSGTEEGDIIESATDYALGRKVKDPKAGNAQYDLGFMSASLAVCCVDPDAPSTTTFDSALQIRDELGETWIEFLFDIYLTHKHKVSPRILAMTPVEFVMAVQSVGDPDEAKARLFFSRLPPGMQWHFTRILASQWLSSLSPSSNTSTDSEASRSSESSTSDTASSDASPAPQGST